jgi:NAD(P)-dependent dehydrogenase (short-subunit alcohol dehydrogenase family)
MSQFVVITGASQGIGAATAVHFTKKGWDVILIARNLENLKAVQKLCSPNSISISCDLSDQKQIDNAVSEIRKNKIQPSCIVNNAGIFKTHSNIEASLDSWIKQFQINLFGAVHLTQKLVPQMKRPGSIVNVASTLGLKPTAETAAYSASKAAMINWTQSLALHLGKENIRVNAVCPGIVDTPIHGFHSLPSYKKSEVIGKMSGLQPLGRIGTSEEIAKSIYFLGSDESSWTTGAALSVDGGINLT